MAEVPVTEIKTVAELNPQTPPPFVASTEGLPPPMNDNDVRAIFAQAAANGIDDLNAVVTSPAPQGQPAVTPASVQPMPVAPVDVPAKFQKADGTVDEEKLKASTEQLRTVVEQKQKSIEELLADYKALEKEHTKVSTEKAQVNDAISRMPAAPQPPINPNDPAIEQLRQQIMQDFQRDPIGTIVELNKAVLQRETAPLLERLNEIKERDRDDVLRSTLNGVAQEDPRILQHWNTVRDVLQEEPAMFRLKNPYKAAWNEVKGRLRLGEPAQTPVQAQPSNPSPTLGRGTPTPVSQLPQPSSPASLSQQVNQVNPYSTEGQRLEEELRRVTQSLWQ